MTGDRSLMIERLASVNYYRLSGYWFPFRRPGEDGFVPGTTFEKIWERYVFDRQLRLLVMDAIERIEIAVRDQLSYHHVHLYGPFAYVEDASSLPKQNQRDREKFLISIKEETQRSREKFVTSFFEKYGDQNKDLPLWMASEIMSFGTLLTFFRGASNQIKKAVANHFEMPSTVFESWLLALNTIRNICAHHSRLWNREIGVKPRIPWEADYPEWHKPEPISNNRLFCILTICIYCLEKVAPQSAWASRLIGHLRSHPQVPLKAMGFPNSWEESPIWKRGAM